MVATLPLAVNGVDTIFPPVWSTAYLPSDWLRAADSVRCVHTPATFLAYYSFLNIIHTPRNFIGESVVDGTVDDSSDQLIPSVVEYCPDVVG